jgi:hypothetical protein
MKNHRHDRNRDIDHSLAVGARAFAIGAVLVLVLAVAHTPSYVAGDPVGYQAFATSRLAQPAPATAPDMRDVPATVDSAPALHIDAPFTSTVADAVPLPPQF